jgi:hypothetical protein
MLAAAGMCVVCGCGVSMAARIASASGSLLGQAAVVVWEKSVVSWGPGTSWTSWPSVCLRLDGCRRRKVDVVRVGQKTDHAPKQAVRAFVVCFRLGLEWAQPLPSVLPYRARSGNSWGPSSLSWSVVRRQKSLLTGGGRVEFLPEGAACTSRRYGSVDGLSSLCFGKGTRQRMAK